jgi:nicotinamidase-related amidase
VNRDVDAEPFPAGGRLVKGSQPFVPRPHLYSRRVNRSALLVLDVQKAFDDPGWGRRNNPACERNIGALIRTWRERGQPVVFIRHDGLEEEAPYDTLRHGTPGNAFKEVVNGEPDLLVAKHVNSAFHGTPDLEAWMRANEIDAFAVCGIQTQMCCETTARVGANLGFDMTFVIDATHTFDLPAYGGGTLTADEVARVTASNLDPEFGRVATTAELIG